MPTNKEALMGSLCFYKFLSSDRFVQNCLLISHSIGNNASDRLRLAGKAFFVVTPHTTVTVDIKLIATIYLI
jgi:hypothetical protein